MAQRRYWSRQRPVYDIYINHYSKTTPKPPKCTLVLRSRPKSAFKVLKMLNRIAYGKVPLRALDDGMHLEMYFWLWVPAAAIGST